MENRIELEKPKPAHAAPELMATNCGGHHHFDKATDTKTGVATTFVREDGAWKVCSTGPR